MSEVVETPEVATPETAPEAAPQTAAPEAPAVETSPDAPPAEPVAPEYQPSYKFKAFNEEKEFDEWARPFIKSKEVEDNFRSLYARAHGMEKYKTDFHDIAQKYQGVNQGLDQLREYVAEGDFDSFFKDTNIPMEAVWNWVKSKMEYHQMEPAQRQEYDRLAQLQRENRELKKVAQSTNSQGSDFEVFKREFSLDNMLKSPEYQKVASEVDKVHGDGAFRAFVAQRGEAIELRTGKECTAEMALQDAVKWIGLQTTQAAPVNQVTNGSVVTSGTGKPVIPNIKGGSNSPVKKKYTSIDEMRADFDSRRKSL